jgi:hypothetical protein
MFHRHGKKVATKELEGRAQPVSSTSASAAGDATAQPADEQLIDA